MRELAEDLCDHSTIFRLEKGKQLPRLEILNDICMKLEIPYNFLFPLNEEVEELKKKCRDYVYAEDYLALEIILEQCNSVLEKLNTTYMIIVFRKFILWHRAILLHKKENNIIEALNILKGLVKLENCTSELDIGIVNSRGLIYLFNKNFDEALKIYKVIFPKIKNQNVKEDFTLLARVGYNYANSLYKLNKFEDALEIIQEVLDYVKKHQLIFSLGEIYHMIGILSKKNGYLKDAEEAFKNSILVFTLKKDTINKARAEADLTNLHNE